jgi:hypothetical protein
MRLRTRQSSATLTTCILRDGSHRPQAHMWSSMQIGPALLKNMTGKEIDGDRFLASIARAYLLDDAKLSWVISGSTLVFLASIWLILSPRIIYSRAMSWDLLFILDGAWRLYTGQVLHVDFHYPIGTLPFLITILGFHLVGIKPFAFVVGESVLAAVLAVFSIIVVKDRLPALPGFLFVSICTLLVLVPVTTGDVETYTFAMSYNRFGWSTISILFLLLFVEPRKRDPVWTDIAVGSLLTVALFYLKITYFGIAVAAISLAMLVSPHVRQHWQGWCGALLLAILIALAPMNRGYRADIIFALSSSVVRSNSLKLLLTFSYDRLEQTLVLGQVIALIYLITRQCARLADVLIGLFIWACGFFLLTQNVQGAIIPLYAVLTLILYMRLKEWLHLANRPVALVVCLMTCALLPLLPPLWSNSVALLGYNIKARQISNAFVVTTTNLRGLAVRLDSNHVLDEVAAEPYARDYFSPIRAWRVDLELSEQEYIRTILALADLLQDEKAASARIVVIDQVNPLPFVLGALAPRGGNLWSGDVAWRPPEEALGDADYVAIPHFPTQRATLIGGLAAYKEYLSTYFARRYETPYWTVLERRSGISRGPRVRVPER